MSQVPRILAVCPGTPRRLRVQGRKLCLCGPGGGTTCGICFGRALANDPIGSGLEGCNQCAGLFAPFVSLGERFRVTNNGMVITGGHTVFGTTSTQDVSAVATFAETYTCSSVDIGGGVCRAVVEEYSGFCTMGGQWSDFGETVVVPGMGVDLGPIFFPGGLPSQSLDVVCGATGTCDTAGTAAPASLTCLDSIAYRHPGALAWRAYSRILAAAFEPFIAQVQNPPFWLPLTLTPWFTHGYFNFASVGFPPVGMLGRWQGMPCSGFMTTTPGPGSANPYLREQFSNTQTGLDSTAAWWAEEGYGPGAAAGHSGAKRTTWNLAEHKAVSVPCAPGDSLNSALIAEHQRRGIEGNVGCCG